MLPKLHGPCSRGGYSKTEMQRFNGIFAKSAIEKERISLRLIPPRRFHLTDKWRLIQRANPFPIHRDNPRFFRNPPGAVVTDSRYTRNCSAISRSVRFSIASHCVAFEQ